MTQESFSHLQIKNDKLIIKSYKHYKFVASEKVVDTVKIYTITIK